MVALPPTDSGAGKRFRDRMHLLFLVMFPGLGAVTAFMPVITLGPIAFAIRQDFAFTTAQIGFASTFYFIDSAALTGSGGWLVGRLGTLRIVRAGLCCSSLLAVAMTFAGSPSFIFAVAGAAGVINGLITPALNILITRVVPDGFRGLAFGIKAGSVPGASALAAVGAWTAATLHTPWEGLYWLSAGMGVTVVALSLLLGAGDRPVQRSARIDTRAPARRSRRSLALLGVGGLLAAAGTAVLPPFVVDGLIDHGQTPGAAATLLAVGSALGIASRVVVGALSDRWPEPLFHLRIVVWMLIAGGGGMATLAARARTRFSCSPRSRPSRSAGPGLVSSITP